VVSARPRAERGAFLPLMEAEETYRALSVKARRILVGGLALSGRRWKETGV